MPAAEISGNAKPDRSEQEQETFPFAVKIRLNNEHAYMNVDGCLIPIKFRHFHKKCIRFGKFEQFGVMNLGFRLYSKDGTILWFEDRCTFADALIQPNTWVDGTIRIPRNVIAFHTDYRLFVDIVVESVFWFCDQAPSGVSVYVSFISTNRDLIFIDTERSSPEQLVSEHTLMLEDQLTTAHARIAELEHAHRLLLAEKSKLEATLEHRYRRIASDAEPRRLAKRPQQKSAIARALQTVE